MSTRRRRALRRIAPNIHLAAEVLEVRRMLASGSVAVSNPDAYRPSSPLVDDGINTTIWVTLNETPSPGTVLNFTLIPGTATVGVDYDLYLDIGDGAGPKNVNDPQDNRWVVASKKMTLQVVPRAAEDTVVRTLSIQFGCETDTPYYSFTPTDVLVRIHPRIQQPPNEPPSPLTPEPAPPNQGGPICFSPTGPPSPGYPATPSTPKPRAIASSGAGAAASPPTGTAGGVDASDGSASFDPLLLYSAGYGKEWGLATEWTGVSTYAEGGALGRGFLNLFQPTVQQTDSGGVRVVKSATDVQWFSSDVYGNYTAAFYGREKLAFDDSTGDYVLTGADGGVTRFYGFGSSVPAAQRGKFKSYADAYRPAVSGGSGHLVTTTYDVSGLMSGQQRTDGAVAETYTYVYNTSGVNSGLVHHVDMARNGVLVRRATFEYYDGTQVGGNVGDLMRETIQDALGNNIDASYFRYYTSDGATGYADGMKYVFHNEAYARLYAAIGDPVSASDATIAAYADNYYEYDSDHRVTKSVVQGAGCSCAGSTGAGEYTYSYSASPFTSGDLNVWRSKTVETLPDGNQNVYYYNSARQLVLHAYSVATDSVDPSLVGKVWATSYRYNAQGLLVQTALPSAVAVTTPSILAAAEANADLVGFNSGSSSYQYINASTGVVYTNEYGATTSGGDVAGYLKADSVRQGYAGTPVPLDAYTYGSRTAAGATIYVLASATVYADANGTGGRTTTYSYAWTAGTTHISSMTTTYPVVGSTQNGPGTADVETSVYDEYGRETWFKDADEYLFYTAYDNKTGAVLQSIVDVDSKNFSSPPFTTISGAGLNLATTYEVDSLGRAIKATDPAGRVTYRVYNDVDHEVRTYRGWNATTGTTTGPIEIVRLDYGRGYDEVLTLAGAPSKTGTAGNYVPDGKEAITAANLRSLSRTLYDLGGRVVERDDYFDFTGLTYSASSVGLGTVGTNYYATKYGYDHRGRLSRVVDAVGTIGFTSYDALGRVSTTSVGTDDPYDATPGSTNMVVSARYVYDGGGVGDGNLTSKTEYVGSTPDASRDRVTQYAYDWRDRLVATKTGVQSSEAADGQRPIVFYDLDNLGEVLAASQYDGDGVALSTTKPAAGLLRAYATYAYDDQGRVYEQRVYAVDPSTGATTSTNYLKTSTFYDRRGDVIAVRAPGGLVSKYQYDGAGRLTSTARTDGAGGSTWAAARTLDGDRVMTETRTRYNAAGDPILVTTLDRNHDAIGTGPLSAAGNPGVGDSGFEAASAGGGIVQGPTGTPWEYAGSAGITANGTAFTSGNRNAPEGAQVAYVLGVAEISQTKVDWQAGAYTISFKAARRAGDAAANAIQILVDDQVVATVTPSSSSYSAYTATFTLTAGKHKITLKGTASASYTSFIDDVKIARGNTAPALGDTGFEDAPLPAGGISGGPSPTYPSPSWAFTAGAGTAKTDSGFFTGASVPSGVQGSQVLYLQSSGSASQAVSLTAGTYTVFFKAAQRQNAANQQQVIQVKVGSAVVATFKPSGSAFEDFAATFTLSSDGVYTIGFAGTVTTGDNTAFVDAVSIARTDARASYAAFYYDAAGRLITAVDVGTNGGRAYERPAASPGRSDTVLVSDYHYDDAGRVDLATDPRGVLTRTFYDGLGRVAKTVDNASAVITDVENRTNSSNVTTLYTYNGLDQVLTVVSVAPTGSSDQTTTYNYGVTTAGGSSFNSNGVLASVVQPDGATKSYAYDGLGRTVKSTDPNGTVHEYAYDVVGRLRSDSVTTFGAGVDQAVKRLETAYDSAGRAYLFTSYDSASGGSIVNQVKDVFNGYGQLLTEYQSHSGAVVDASSLKVQYGYTSPGSGATSSRLVSETYPNGRVLAYTYGSGVDDAIGRITAITDGVGGPVLESYKYLGLGTIVEKAQPGGGVRLTYIRQADDAAARGDAGDRYSGLDRFGRVIDQNWVRNAASAGGAAAGTSTVRLQYGYDRADDALYRRDLVNDALSELYQYDQLGRLTSMKRGSLNAANNAIASPSFEQSWSLDSRGNQASSTTIASSTTTVSKSFNEANETTSVSGGAAPTYDAAGNTTLKDGSTYVYDAWNRLVQVKQGSTVVASYAFDSLGRRVVETAGGTTSHLYFDGGSAVEERQGTFGYQYVYGLTGRLALRDTYSNITGSATLDWRTYAEQDVNGDVVALVRAGSFVGNVGERYAYAPYGAASILDAAGGSRSSSSFQWEHLFQGGRLDPATGLYQFGFRDYDPSAGVWMQRDPIGLAGGDLNLYRFVGNNPTNHSDPSGLIDWSGVAVRAGGALQMVGGVAESMAGGLLLVAPEPTAMTKVGGVLVVGHGIDTAMAGMNTLLHGTPTDTFTTKGISNAAQSAGMSKENADTFARAADSTIGIVSPVAASRRILPAAGGALYRPLKPASPGRVPGNASDVSECLPPLSGGAPISGWFRRMNPLDIRFSQRSAGGNGRAAILRESMRDGWNGPAIDAVETAEGIVTLDNTRIAIARELGITEVPVMVHPPAAPLPESMIGRFGNAETWGEALAHRTGTQRPPLPNTGTLDSPRLPSN